MGGLTYCAHREGYLFLCLHLEINSFLLFSRWRVSAFIMYNFSVRHWSHLFDPHLYGEAKDSIAQCVIDVIVL